MPRRVETTQSGEQVIGRLTPTGRDANASFPTDPNANRRASRARQRWEGTAEGQARTQSITPETHGVTAGQFHFERNYDRPTVGPRHYDVQLPGMADPNAAPRPPKWEELSREQQNAAEAGARAFGTSHQTMQRDLGSQIDQAVLRAASHGHDRGNTEDFYSTGRPRQVIESSARELGISPLLHAQMNAMTSPNTKFQANRSTGEIFYPNDEAARHAVKSVQQGVAPERVTNRLSTTGSGSGAAQGYVTNIRKAASAFRQSQEGVRPGDWITNKAGDAGPFDNSPKTGPYANSWNDTHPQFAVADVHTGGGGALPHLSSAKPVQRDSEGNERYQPGSDNPIRDKSEREKAIARIPHFHSMMDNALRGAMSERNMPSVRDAQALQWGEEQIQRGLVRPEVAYTKQSRQQLRGQAKLDLGAEQVTRKHGQQGWDFG